jgi:hypothetical protein
VSFEEAMQPLLDCMCDALAVQGWEGDCCLAAVEPSFVNCCDGADEDGVGGGGAWGRLVRAYPSSRFPAEDGNAGLLTECSQAMQWALVIELGATRCICYELCDCAVRAQNATRVLEDMEAALQGVLCCFTSGACRGIEFQVQSIQPTNGRGGCGGFKIQIVRQYTMTCCPSDEST